MTLPAAFTIYPVTLARTELTYWRLSDPMVEKLWLPLIGPTPFVLVRYLNGVLEERAGAHWGEPVTFRTADVAEHIGVAPRRAFESVLRLRRFHLLEEDDITTEYDHPCYCWRGAVRPIGVKEWRRLPASVREEYAEIPL